MATVVVVLGYGCHLTEDLERYLQQVIHYIKTHDVAAIITSGGFTNRRSMPGVSEAGLMAHYLVHEGLVTIPIYIDEASRTRNENLRNTAALLDEHLLTKHDLVIFSDAARRLKVRLLATIIMDRIVEVRGFPLPISTGDMVKQLIIATPLDILAEFIPPLRRRQLLRREAIMDRS